MDLTKLATELSHLNYIVQRNWEGLPEDMGGDLDVFVSNDDLNEFRMIIKGFGIDDFTDIRFPGDGYYPSEIENILLEDILFYKGFKIPSVKSHFISLYYHNIVHKKNDPYKLKLKQLFFEWFPPTEPEDKGVGYYV